MAKEDAYAQLLVSQKQAELALETLMTAQKLYANAEAELKEGQVVMTQQQLKDLPSCG